MKKTRREQTDLPKHIDSAIRAAWPDGVIDLAVDRDAPFAVMALDQVEVFEDGSWSEPDVDPHIFDPDGRNVDPEDHYREFVGEAAFTVLEALRAEIVRVLAKFAVTVVPDADLERPVRWLRASEDVVVGEPVTVRDAFFCRGV